MKRSRQIGRRFGMVALLATVLWVAFALWRPFELRYQGIRLSRWAEQLSLPDGYPAKQTPQEHDAAVRAIRHFGTNALPLALDDCAARDSWLRKRFVSWLDGQNSAGTNMRRFRWGKSASNPKRLCQRC